MNPQLIGTIFGIALAIMGLGTAVVIGLRGTALKADLDRVRDSNEDIRKTNDDLRKEIADKERHTMEQDARIHDLERDYNELKAENIRKDRALARIGEVAASTAEIREMVGVLKDHDIEAAARHASTIKVLKEIRDNQNIRKQEEEQK